MPRRSLGSVTIASIGVLVAALTGHPASATPSVTGPTSNRMTVGVPVPGDPGIAIPTVSPGNPGSAVVTYSFVLTVSPGASESVTVHLDVDRSGIYLSADLPSQAARFDNAGSNVIFDATNWNQNFVVRVTAINPPGGPEPRLYELTHTPSTTGGVYGSADAQPILEVDTRDIDGAGMVLQRAGGDVMTFTGSGTPTPSMSANGLPNGVGFIDDGVGHLRFTGTPATGSGGVRSVTVTATDSQGTAQKTLELTVREAASILGPATVSFERGVAADGVRYEAHGFPPPALDAGALPEGLTFTQDPDGNGTLAGTPTTLGTTTVTLTASNGVGSPTTLDVTISVVDTIPPETTITDGPSGVYESPDVTNDRTPRFTFSSSEPGSTFECRVDSGSWTSCSSPHHTASLPDGPHEFAVQAADSPGNVDATAATRSFEVRPKCVLVIPILELCVLPQYDDDAG